MAMKTVWRALAILFLALAPLPPLNSQTSPLDWPPPPALPPLPRPAVLMDGGELAAALANGTAVPFDVRSVAAYAAGHLPGAVPAWSPEEEGPVGHEGLGQVRSLLATRGLSGTETIVLYGDDGDPDREAVGRLFWLLRSAGCASVRVLDGGLAAWRRAGRSLATGPSRRPGAEFHPVRRDEVTVDAPWVETSYGEAGVEILDLRDARGWDRWETPPLFAAGHIPYSLPWDTRALLPKAGGWPQPDEVRGRIGKLGPRPGDPVLPNATFVLYGDDARDPRLGLGYLILSLAGFDVRVFAGGWAGWTEGGQRPQRPVIRVLSAREVAALLAPENPGLSGDDPPRGLILFDLREAGDFAIGHLPGARSLPDRLFPSSFEKSVQEGWPGADRAAIPLLLYCYGVECVRSRKAGAAAAHAGFRHVLWFRGGIREWRQAGYPLPESPVTAPGRPGSPAGSAARP